MMRSLALLLLAAALAAGEPLRLANADAELAVQGESGRLIALAPRGGRNLLWVHPAPFALPGSKGGWTNWGGAKLWLWPPEDWAAAAGRAWPPAMDDPARPWTARRLGDRIVAVSPDLPGFGVRLVREFALAPQGVACTVTSRAEILPGAVLRPGTAFWEVAQLPLPRALRVRAAAGAAVTVFEGDAWRWRPEGADLRCERRGGRGKIGCDADAFRVDTGDGVLELAANRPSTAPAEPGVRAQVYSEEDASPDLPAGCPSYIELEFTAPIAAPEPFIVAWSWRPSDRSLP